MIAVFIVHRILGEMILPVLIIAAAVVAPILWNPDQPRSPWMRVLAILIDIQVTLGLIWWIYAFDAGFAIPRGLASVRFLLHPLLGFATAGFGHAAASARSPFRKLGRRGLVASALLVLFLAVLTILAARLRG
jgi:hypothetical protein